MMTFYAAAGSYQIRSEDGKNMPYIMRLGKLQPVSIPEFSLWSKLLYEMAVDIMEEGGHDLSPVEASALERAEVARRLNVYLDQLPEYQDRISFVFERK